MALEEWAQVDRKEGRGEGNPIPGRASPEGEFGARAAYPPRAKPEDESDEGAKKKKKKGGGGGSSGGGGAGPGSAKKAARPKQAWRDWDDDDG